MKQIEQTQKYSGWMILSIWVGGALFSWGFLYVAYAIVMKEILT